ncbi:hypothetical protein RH831_06795 [Halodesulfurarchaeum sp. HSR-GB]|nr:MULTISPECIES: hypothetical protein [Halodesulfurarchaeum]MDR5656886.1 hypothetical protein [Halodesulfurarchaeum sp. HSR-GB]
MRTEPYQKCQSCGRPLEHSTVYRNHAYCGQCSPGLGGTTL